MDCPPKKLAVVERWPLVNIQYGQVLFNISCTRTFGILTKPRYYIGPDKF